MEKKRKTGKHLIFYYTILIYVDIKVMRYFFSLKKDYFNCRYDIRRTNLFISLILSTLRCRVAVFSVWIHLIYPWKYSFNLLVFIVCFFLFYFYSILFYLSCALNSLLFRDTLGIKVIFRKRSKRGKESYFIIF